MSTKNAKIDRTAGIPTWVLLKSLADRNLETTGVLLDASNALQVALAVIPATDEAEVSRAIISNSAKRIREHLETT